MNRYRYRDPFKGNRYEKNKSNTRLLHRSTFWLLGRPVWGFAAQTLPIDSIARKQVAKKRHFSKRYY
jgi:hypothetical protein